MTNVHKYNTALFIGRFQPFHNGHLYSLKKCLEIADRVVLGVGSSNEWGTSSNPWSYEARKKMIESLGYGLEIVAIPDTESDLEWVEQVGRLVDPTGDVIVSNNEWVTSLMSDAGYSVYEPGLYQREELEGVKIRELMRVGDEGWKKRAPVEIVRLFENNDIEMIR